MSSLLVWFLEGKNLVRSEYTRIYENGIEKTRIKSIEATVTLVYVREVKRQIGHHIRVSVFCLSVKFASFLLLSLTGMLSSESAYLDDLSSKPQRRERPKLNLNLSSTLSRPQPQPL